MGYFKKDGYNKTSMFFIEHDSDLDNLPTSTKEGTFYPKSKVPLGSTAFCIETSKTYMLDASDTWTEIQLGSGVDTSVIEADLSDIKQDIIDMKSILGVVDESLEDML